MVSVWDTQIVKNWIYGAFLCQTLRNNKILLRERQAYWHKLTNHYSTDLKTIIVMVIFGSTGRGYGDRFYSSSQSIIQSIYSFNQLIAWLTGQIMDQLVDWSIAQSTDQCCCYCCCCCHHRRCRWLVIIVFIIIIIIITNKYSASLPDVADDAIKHMNSQSINQSIYQPTSQSTN